MSSLLLSYDKDANDKLKEVRVKISLLNDGLDQQRAHSIDATQSYTPPPPTGALSRAHQLHDAQETLSCVKNLVSTMLYEASNFDPALRARVRDRVDDFRRTISRLEVEVNELRHKCTQADRADLMGFGKGNSENGNDFHSEDDRDDRAYTNMQRLAALQTSERLQGGTRTLLKAEAYLNKTSDMAHDTHNTLRTQGEQISHIDVLTGDVDHEVSQARLILNRIQRTAIKHKLYLCAIIAVLFLVIMFIIYSKMKK